MIIRKMERHCQMIVTADADAEIDIRSRCRNDLQRSNSLQRRGNRNQQEQRVARAPASGRCQRSHVFLASLVEMWRAKKKPSSPEKNINHREFEGKSAVFRQQRRLL